MKQGSTSRLAVIGSLPAQAIIAAVVVLPVVTLALGHLELLDVVDIWSRPGVAEALWFSTWQAAISTIVTVVLGVIPTWIVTRYRFRGRAAVHLILTAPFVLPTVVVGAAFLAVLPNSLDRSVWAIVAAHVFFNISLVIRTVGPTWALLDDDLIHAARTLGASPIQIWRQVLIPLARPAVRASATLIFLLCFTSFGVVRIVGGPGRATIDVEIYRRAVLLGDTSGATALALSQTVVIAIAATVWMRRRSTALHTAHATRSLRPARLSLCLTAYGAAAIMSIPVLALIMSSLRSSTGWTLRGYRVVFGTETVERLPLDIAPVVMTSLLFAVIAVLIAVPSGLAAAQALTRRRRESSLAISQSALSALLTFPLGTSAVVIGFGILITYDRAPFDFRSSWLLIPVVHAAVALPFVVRAAVPVLESIPVDLRHVAATLGASPWQRFVSIDLALLRPAVTSAVALSGALSLGEFGATSFLTRRDTETLPIAIARLLGRAGSLSFTTGMAAATLLLVLTMTIITLADSGSRQ